MKKILNILLICSLLGVSQTSVIAKNKKEKVKNSDKIEIVKPEKQKVNKRQERKKNASVQRAQKSTSKEAKGMYETKFPAITSQIEYADERRGNFKRLYKTCYNTSPDNNVCYQ